MLNLNEPERAGETDFLKRGRPCDLTELEEIVAAGQKLEAKVLLKAVKLYLAKRLDVYWGTVKRM